VVASVHAFATVLEPLLVASGTCRDANDLPVLGTAAAAGADVLVTGDKDLLVLVRFGDTRIHSPHEFYDQFVSGA